MSKEKLPHVFLTRGFSDFRNGAAYTHAYRERKFPEDIEYVPASEMERMRRALERIKSGPEIVYFREANGSMSGKPNEARDIAAEALKDLA